MTKIKLAYGSGNFILDVPKRNLTGFYEPKKILQKKSSKTIIEEAMKAPLGKSIESLCNNKTVCCLIEDGTRSEPHDLIAEAFSKRLTGAKLVKFVITTGTHKDHTEKNKKIVQQIKKYAKKHKLNFVVQIHNCRKASFDYVGKTKWKTPVYVNSFANNCDLFVIGSDAKNHYFAGYSNPIKNFLPGICAFKTVEKNHSFALLDQSTFGRHPLHPNKKMRKCPVAEDQYEAMKLIVKDRPVFVLGMISSKGKVYYAKSGEIHRVTKNVIKKIDQMTSFKVKPQKYIIVSPGHNPDDGSLYVSQRALELTKNAVKKNGEILFFSECKDGVSYDKPTMKEFYLPMKQPLNKILNLIKKKYVLYSHKAYKFAKLIQNTNEIYIYSSLKKKWFEDVHLKTTNDPQLVVDKWIKKNKNAKILVFNEANKLAIYKK